MTVGRSGLSSRRRRLRPAPMQGGLAAVPRGAEVAERGGAAKGQMWVEAEAEVAVVRMVLEVASF
jgi:hypothetical protein